MDACIDKRVKVAVCVFEGESVGVGEIGGYVDVEFGGEGHEAACRHG